MTKRILAALAAMLLAAVSAFAQPLAQPVESPAPSLLTSEVNAPPASARSFWTTVDYLFAVNRASHLPSLVTTSVPGTPRPAAGILGVPTTTTLFGGWANDELRSGVRLGAGWWFEGDRNFGVDIGFLVLESQSAIFSGSSDGSPILARPYTSALDGTQEAVLVAFPGATSGSIDIRAQTANFYTGHAVFTEKAIDEGWFRLNAQIGYRYYRYDESLRIGQVVTPTDPNFIAGTTLTTRDIFATRNDFHGCDIGVRSQFVWDSLTLDVLTRIAVGKIYREVQIDGSQIVAVPGAAPVSQVGGVYALSSNSGLFTRSDWKTMPEITATLSWRVLANLNVRLGYTFLLLDNIVRAPDQIEPLINPNLFPPAVPGASPNQPAFSMHRTSLWIQSINLGLEFTY
ncbi:MAG: BBP7 family outer membrane beta-barrel protein [Planctomycetes bacterium]|nr:BBP7 family outer membrane beta-barrel protein [Planctomycetota bacterium]